MVVCTSKKKIFIFTNPLKYCWFFIVISLNPSYLYVYNNIILYVRYNNNMCMWCKVCLFFLVLFLFSNKLSINMVSDTFFFLFILCTLLNSTSFAKTTVRGCIYVFIYTAGLVCTVAFYFITPAAVLNTRAETQYNYAANVYIGISFMFY